MQFHNLLVFSECVTVRGEKRRGTMLGVIGLIGVKTPPLQCYEVISGVRDRVCV